MTNKTKKAGLRDKLEARKQHNENEDILPYERREPKGRPIAPDIPKEIFMQKMDLEMFPEIEKHVNLLSGKPANNMTFQKIMVDYIVDLQTELEIIRTMFLWIILQDLPAIQQHAFPANLKPDTPMGFFCDIVEGKKTVAELYARLVSEAGIHVKVITGLKKGPKWYPDYKFTKGNQDDPFRGAWNAVFVDGHWRFIDVSSALALDAFENRSKTWEEYYFLPDPSHLISTHFPDEKLWQLLLPLQTIELADFQAAPKKWPMYYSCSAELPKKLPAYIAVPDRGFIQFEISVPVEARVHEMYKCELMTRSGEKRFEGSDMTRYVLYHSQENKDTIQVFCPKRAEFILELYVMTTKFGAVGVYNLIAIYQLKCDKAVSNFDSPVKPPFPKICSYYGLNPLAYKQGISKTSLEALVQCDKFGEGTVTIVYNNTATVSKKGKGEASAQMKKVPRFLDFAQTLYSADNDQEPEPNRVLQCSHEKGDKTEVTFMFRVPDEGNYALILYYNESRTAPEYVDFAHFMISWKRSGSANSEPFPHISKGKLGPNIENCERLGVRLSAIYPADTNNIKDSWVFGNECGEAILRFKHDKPLSFTAERVDEDVSVCIECTPNDTYLTIRSLVKSERKTFLLKVYASEVDHTGQMPLIHQFMIMVVKPTSNSMPFPVCPNHYWGGVQNRMNEFNATIKEFSSCSSWSEDKFKIKENEITKIVPGRAFTGGDDMQIVLAYKAAPFAIKPMLKLIEKGSTLDYDKYCISQRTDLTSTIIRMRFPKTGSYILALFGAPLGGDESDQQLVPFYYCFICAEFTSASTKPFPNTFALWSSCAHNLEEGLCLDNGFFKRNKKAEYKIELMSLTEEKGKGYTEVPFYEVVLLVDEKTIITAKPDGTPGVYEWEYMPGDGTRKISIAVVPSRGSEEVLFALTYNLV